MLDLILNDLKVLLAGYPSITLTDEVLMLYAKQGLQSALSYCNREEMPNEAVTTIAFICLDMIVDRHTESIKSISEGDSSVSFNNLSALDLTKEHKKALSIYRQARAI